MYLCGNGKYTVWKDMMRVLNVVCAGGSWYCTDISWIVGCHEWLGCCSEWQIQRNLETVN
jgi:hypothetical protein